MAACLACEAKFDSGEVEIGEILICSTCGADMEVVAIHPLQLELVDDDEVGEDDADDEEDDDADEEEEFAA